ncbi:MAG: ribonuclease activity regulator RraA [Chloroflexi bacterium]|nr:ribonuclease activity regulator RraA [Chloroflexota bacterium]
MATQLKPAPTNLLERLKDSSSATVVGVLNQMGYRFVFMQGVLPLRPGSKLVGQAVTLRYLPRREDHVVTQETRPSYAQHVAIESVQRGDVLVVDARGVVDAAIFGDLLVSRLRYRGGAGLVTDGALRDSPYLRTLDFPCFVRSAHGSAHNAWHFAMDVNLPIACGGVLVEPGDILVGDDDGVVVIPGALGEEVADRALDQESKETFTRELIDRGASINDVHPLTPEMLAQYQEWLKSRR